MNGLNIAVQTIKDSVSALDVANALGWEVRHGRCKCPIHGGMDYNCRLYPGDRGYVCWVCKSGGDVVKLVRESVMQGASFKDVLAWFNSTFHLGLNIDSPLSPEAVKQAEIAQRKRKEEQEFKAWLHKTRFDLFLTADKIVSLLEEQRDKYVPKTPDEPWHHKFCEAIALLPEARQFAQDCYFDCIEVKT